MLHKMKLNNSPFLMIKSGEKTIELRLNDDKRRLVKIGDEIEFSNTDDNNQKLLTKVTALHRFENFEKLYESLPLLKCGYTKDDISSAKPEDMEYYYSKQEQKIFGVLGIELTVLSNGIEGEN